MTSYNLQQELTSLTELIVSLDLEYTAHRQEELDIVTQRLLEACRACYSQRNALTQINRVPPETMLHIFAMMEVNDLLHGAFFFVKV